MLLAMDGAIEPYNSEWPSRLTQILAGLYGLLHDIPGIEYSHIGSTSVPSLSAQPTIDILLAGTPADLNKATAALTSSKRYERVENGRPTFGTLFSARGESHLCAHNLYICASDSLAMRVHIAVRDTLRENKQLRDEYAAIKTRALALAEDADDKGKSKRSTYAEDKKRAMQEILIASGKFTPLDLATVFSSGCSARWAPIRTPRTIIREFKLTDVDGMFTLEGNEENAKYQDWPPWTHLRARKTILEGIRTSYEIDRTVVELGVEHEGGFIGRIGGRVSSSSVATDEQKTMCKGESAGTKKTTRHIDLWYSFMPSHQGKGLASEAMTAFVAQLVEKKRVGRESMELEIECDPRNAGSWKLAERLGFSKHSLTERAWESKGEWVDSLVYRKMV